MSVVIPTFRRRALLEAALRSVRAQTHRPLQVIVVDDDDDPTTGDVVEMVFAGAADLDAEFMRQPNRGAPAARNCGLAAARGAFVQFLDDDDELFPDKISEQAGFLLESGADAVFGDWAQGQDIASAREFRVRETDNHFMFLTAEGWIPQFAYLTRTDACRAVGGWSEALRFNDDFDFFLRIAADGAGFRHQPVRTGFYRWHPGPRVSAESRALRIAANMRIIENAETLLRARRPASAGEIGALLVYWRKLAAMSAATGDGLDICTATIDRLRRELGEAAGPIESRLGPRRYYALRAVGGPGDWARVLMRRLLPRAARRRFRRWANGMRAALGRASWKL